MRTTVVSSNSTPSQDSTAVEVRPLPADLLASTELLKGLTAGQLAQLSSVCREQHFDPGELILREGEPDPFVYVLTNGRAQLSKHTSSGGDEMQMGELRSGAVLGELKIVDPQPSSASIVAITPVTAVAIDLDAFAGSAGLAGARATVLANIGKILADRLRARTGQGADAMRRELEESRARAHAGRFIVLMFVMVTIYQLALSALDLLDELTRPNEIISSFAFVIWTVIPVALSLRHNPFSLETYGLTMQGGRQIALQALIWTIPLLVLLFALKLAAIWWLQSAADRPLFDVQWAFVGHSFNLGFYLFGLFLYTLHAPLQEFVVRTGLQGTLQHFIPVPPGRINWKAIIVSNLVFASGHTILGFWFAVASFVPGLFWGWMFAKQGSLIGVTVSHLVLGLWALFALGMLAVVSPG